MSQTEISRLRREYRSEARIGKFVSEAAEEADNRVIRAIQGPPPTEAEQAVLAGAPREQVRLYTRVVVTDLQSGEQERFRIVGEGEGDLLQGEISLSSPIGRALLMGYPGDIVAAKTPGGTRLYRILQVEP